MSTPFRMKLLQKCCCGCTVKTGALIVCYMTLIQVVVSILNILSDVTTEVGKDSLTNEYKRGVNWFCIVTIVIVAHCLFGIYKRKAGYMVPFLLYKLVLLFFLTMMLGFAPAIVDMFSYATTTNGGTSKEDILPCFIVVFLLAIAVEAYALLILFSHYQNVRQAAFESSQVPAVGFSTSIGDAEVGAPCGNTFNADLSKKTPPPPYAV